MLALEQPVLRRFWYPAMPVEGTDYDVPLDMHSAVERHMPSDQPGLLMRRRMLLDLLAAHREREQTRHYQAP